MIHLLETQLEATRRKEAYALVTLVKTEGVTPRGVGSKMVVFEDGSFEGTIGGGVLEKQVLVDAVECLRDRGKMLKEYENRAEEDGSPCGGLITVFIDSIKSAPDLVVCGAGHVGAAVINLASTLGYYITAIDTRDTEMTAENVKNADKFQLVDDFYNGLKSLSVAPGAFYMISTFGHAQDGEGLAAALEKDAAYIGMMGGPPKIKSLFAKLREKGFSEEQLAFIHTPVGLDIGGETPPEIAVSIMSEMQMIRYGGTGRPAKGLL